MNEVTQKPKKAKRKAKKKVTMVEVTRSFSFKRNLGNYQTANFFCSAKKECKESEAEATSEALYKFCKAEVIKSAYPAKPKPKPVQQEAPTRPYDWDAGWGGGDAEENLNGIL